MTMSAVAQATPSIDLSVISKLTNLNEINRLLHETLAKERTVQNNLDQLLTRRGEVERNVLVLNATSSETLELVRADAEQLLSSVQTAREVADQISQRVRVLDIQQVNVENVLNHINVVLDRSKCIHGLQAAMDNSDYEAAVDFFLKFVDLEAKVPSGVQDGDVSQVEQQREVVTEARKRLEGIVDEKLQSAITNRSTRDVMRYVSLYVPLGQGPSVLKTFIAYVKSLVGSQLRSHYEEYSDQLDANKDVDCLGFLTAIFKDCGVAVEENEEFVKKTFGPETVVEMVTGIQEECDTQGTRLLRRFLEHKRVVRTLQEVNSKKGRQGTPGDTGGPDPKKVEPLLGTLVRLCQVSEEYNHFMVDKMRRAVAPAELTPIRETTYYSGAFNLTVKEIIGYYMSLETYYLAESCRLAISMDEVMKEVLTSTVVDDIFFILRRGATRGLATHNLQCVCALVTEVHTLLASTFQGALLSKLQGGAARLMAAAPPVTGAGMGDSLVVPAPGALDHAVMLNNADVSSEYMMKLSEELEALAAEVFSAPDERDRVHTIIRDLTRSSLDFRQLTEKAIDQLADGIMPRLRPALDDVASISYTMSESEYESQQAAVGWVARLVLGVTSQVQWLKPLLTTSNYEALLHHVLDKVAARLDVLLSRKTFNQLGGLQLDKDIRALVMQLSELTTRTVRDKFARLSQMALLLSLESVEEFLDYWVDDSGHTTWRLTSAEAKGILGQRSDFNKEVIASLVL